MFEAFRNESRLICLSVRYAFLLSALTGAATADPTYGLAKPPPVGEHPRICLSPCEVAQLRLRVHVEPARSGYEQCRKLLKALSSSGDGGLLPIVERMEQHAELKEEERQRVAGALRDSALVALLEDSAGPPVRRALLAYVRSVDPESPALDFSRNGPGVAFAYDWAFRHLNEAERAEVRAWLSRACTHAEAALDNAPWGFRPRDGKAFESNWTSFISSAFGLTALAIEGEPGFKPRWFEKSAASLQAFLDHGIGAEGAPFESIHYFAYGMTNGIYFLDAMARRGRPVWSHPKLMLVPHYWMNDMFPFGPDFNSLQDTRDLHTGCEDVYDRLHLAWPDNPVMQRVYERYLENPNTQELIHSGRALWARPPDLAVAARAASEPSGRYFAQNGLLYARSDWSSDACYLSFQSDPVLYGPSHAHADRNSFTFAALGRLWAMDGGGWLPQDVFHNEVLIDGKGEGYFPQAGRIVDFADAGWAVAITGDAKLAYDWRTNFGPDNSPAHRNEWRQIGGKWSAAYNPVQGAFRTVAFVRGPHPYVLISDDIRKDGKSHSYEWRMLTPLSNQARMLPDGRGVQLEPFEASVEPVGYQPIAGERQQPLAISFTVPQGQAAVVWVLAGHQSWEPWYWSIFTKLDNGPRERTMVASGDSAPPHWQRLIPAKGEKTLAGGSHIVVLETMGLVRIYALLVAPVGFDPRIPLAAFPKDARLITMQNTPLPRGWREIADATVNARLDVRILTPDKTQLNASVLRCIRPDNHADYGDTGLVTATAQSVEPHFRVLLWPHLKDEVAPQISWDGACARLRWPDGVADSWEFGAQLEGERQVAGSRMQISVKTRD